MHLLPTPLLTLLYLTLLHPATATASPSPPLISTDHAMSLVPYHQLFYRQLKDLQTFPSALGGVHASSIMNSGIPDRPFQVEGANFPDFRTAAQRSCDEQFQGCQQMANQAGNGNGSGNGNGGNGGNGGNADGSNGGNGGGGNNNNNNGGRDMQDGKGKGKGKGSPRDQKPLTVNMCEAQKGEIPPARSAESTCKDVL